MSKKTENKKEEKRQNRIDFVALAEKHQTNKHFPHHYASVYEKHLKNLSREKVKAVLEIGIYDASSHRMWAEYFPQATVYGIDTHNFKKHDGGRLETYFGDQANREHLENIVNDIACDGFDLIVDNGGHHSDQTQVSMGFLFSYLKPGGWYVIESLHVCPETEGAKVQAKHLKSNEISTLSLLRHLRDKTCEEISITFMKHQELTSLISSVDSCYIEMGVISEIAFLQKKKKSKIHQASNGGYLPYLARKHGTDKHVHGYIHFFITISASGDLRSERSWRSGSIMETPIPCGPSTFPMPRSTASILMTKANMTAIGFRRS